MAASAMSFGRQEDHEEYICTICLQFFEVPVKTPCNHLFCRECLSQALSDKSTCPGCRSEVSIDQIRDAQKMDRKMRSLKLHCDRCGAQFRPIDGRQHERICVPKPVKMQVAQQQQEGSLGLKLNPMVFACSYCGTKNFSRESLLEHCNKQHKQAPNHKLVCSICVAYPWGKKEQVSGHLLDHLNTRHKFDMDLFVDLQEDEETSLQDAIKRSLYN